MLAFCLFSITLNVKCIYKINLHVYVMIWTTGPKWFKLLPQTEIPSWFLVYAFCPATTYRTIKNKCQDFVQKCCKIE
jgi:hypothetical protein